MGQCARCSVVGDAKPVQAKGCKLIPKQQPKQLTPEPFQGVAWANQIPDLPTGLDYS